MEDLTSSRAFRVTAPRPSPRPASRTKTSTI
jgi:hypothetical protein